MASSVTVNGQRTSVPSIVADPKFVTSGRAIPAAKVLAITGPFEQFENGKTYEFRNAGALRAAAPGDDLVDQIAGIAFNPGGGGSPASLIVASSLPSTAAASPLVDSNGVEAAVIKSRVFGSYGNFFSYTLTANTSDAKLRDILLSRQGATEVLSGLGSGPVIRLGYAGSWADKIMAAVVSPVYDAGISDVDGTIQIALLKNLASPWAASSVSTADRTATGQVKITPSAALGVADTFTGVTVTAATDTLDVGEDHGLLVDDQVLVSSVTGGGLPAGTYYVESAPSSSTLKLKTTEGNPAYDITADGTLTLAYKPVTVTLVGLDGNGAAATEIVTLPAGEANVVLSTGSWSRIDTVTPSVSGFAGTLAVSWTVRRVTRQSGASSLAAAASLLNDLPNVTASVRSARANELKLGDLDFLPSTDFSEATLDLRADRSEMVRQINARSRFITAERSLPTTAAVLTSVGDGVASGTAASANIVVSDTSALTAGAYVFIGLPDTEDQDYPMLVFQVASVTDGTTFVATVASPINFAGAVALRSTTVPAGRVAAVTGTSMLAGGTAGATTSDTRDTMYDALKLTQTAVLVPMSLNSADLARALAHAELMAGIGARELCVYAGAPVDSDLDDIDELTMGFNTRHISIATEEIRVVDSTGARRWLDTRFQALQVAAMQCGVGIGVPINGKRPRVYETRSNTAWNGTKNADEIIQRGAIAYSRDDKGYKITRMVTTYRGDDVNQTDCSANESVNWQIRDMREELLTVADKNSAEFDTAALKGLCIQRGRKQQESKLITKFLPETVDLQREADTTIVIYDFEPAVPNNFTILRPNVRPVRASFTLA